MYDHFVFIRNEGTLLKSKYMKNIDKMLIDEVISEETYELVKNEIITYEKAKDLRKKNNKK